MPLKLAASVKVGFCTNCLDPHILLLDENGETFAQAVIYAEHGSQLIANIQRILDFRVLKDALKERGEGGDDQVS